MRHAPSHRRLTVEAYLQGELRSEVRHEYVNGEVFAMVGAGVAHNIIALNVASALRNHLRDGPCQGFVSDVKVHIKEADDERFYYPDVFVACDPRDGEPYYRDHPRLIVEVLSEHTERNDRSDKFYAYRRIPTLMEYVLVAQDVQRVEVYRRETSWDLELYGKGQRFRLDSADMELSVAEVYESVEVDGGSAGNGSLRG